MIWRYSDDDALMRTGRESEIAVDEMQVPSRDAWNAKKMTAS